MSQELTERMKEGLRFFSILVFSRKPHSLVTISGLLGRKLVTTTHPFEITRKKNGWSLVIQGSSIRDPEPELELKDLMLEDLTEIIYSFKKNYNAMGQDMRELLVKHLKEMIH